LKPRWEKKVLRELEVGNAPVFVAFGLLLPFFLAVKNLSPSEELQRSEALDGTITPKCISPVLQSDKKKKKPHMRAHLTVLRSAWTLW